MHTQSVAARSHRHWTTVAFGPRAGAVAVILAWALVAGCSRPGTTQPLSAAFDDGQRLGSTTAVWENTGDERAFAGGARLAELEVRFRYRIDATNRTDDKVFLRLADVTLATQTGMAVATDAISRECVLGPGDTPAALAGEIWVPRSKADTVVAVSVSRFAAPLGKRDLPHYRAWLLQGRPGNEAAVDSEIGAQAATPPCAGH